MRKILLPFKRTPLLILLALSACASVPSTVCKVTPPAVVKQVAPSALAPLPPANSFSVCLRQILAYGKGQGQISAQCSALLQTPPTK